MCPTAFNACVARPVAKKEMLDTPLAMQAMEKEWDRLWKQDVWGHTGIRERPDVAKEAQRKGKTVHLGWLFGLCVQQGSELPDGDPRNRFKYRVVFGGNNVIDQSWESALSESRRQSLLHECGKVH